MVLLSFVDIQKIWIFTKFGGCSSKIEPATPISVLKLKRAWQTQFFSHTLQILVNDRFLIGHQMILSSISCISSRKAYIWERLSLPHKVSPIWYVIVHNHDFLYQVGDTLQKKRQIISNFSFPITDTKKWWKYDLMAYKRSIIDQNLKGIAHLIRLPRPWEVWN